MSIRQTLALSTAGAGLVTSNSFWFFDSSDSQPIQAAVSTEIQTVNSTPIPAPEPLQLETPHVRVEMNKLSPVPPLETRGQILKNEKFKTGKLISNSGVYFTLEEGGTNKYLSVIQSRLENFSLNFPASREDYMNFDKENIKISLFKNPAWYSSTNNDEYEKELSKEEINELFQGLDEAKVKQLLISLQKKRKWMWHTGATTTLTFYSDIHRPSNMNELRDLKIKYFREFKKLKDYITKKVAQCTDEKFACVADPQELDIMDTDKMSFFEELKAKQNAQ